MYLFCRYIVHCISFIVQLNSLQFLEISGIIIKSSVPEKSSGIGLILHCLVESVNKTICTIMLIHCHSFDMETYMWFYTYSAEQSRHLLLHCMKTGKYKEVLYHL